MTIRKLPPDPLPKVPAAAPARATEDVHAAESAAEMHEVAQELHPDLPVADLPSGFHADPTGLNPAALIARGESPLLLGALHASAPVEIQSMERASPVTAHDVGPMLAAGSSPMEVAARLAMVDVHLVSLAPAGPDFGADSARGVAPLLAAARQAARDLVVTSIAIHTA